MKKIAIHSVVFLLVFLAIFFYMKKNILPAQECSSKFPFLSREIDCQKIDDVSNRVDELHGDIAKIIDEEKASGHLVRGAVFYRDLNTRRWFGVNDSVEYYPASLIKLPIALVYYKIAELQPGILDKQIAISMEVGNQDNSDLHYPPQEKIVPGNSYSVRELIRHMLVYSDNVPFAPLSDGVRDYSERVLTDLGIYIPLETAAQGDWNVTPKSYANIFRMLYNASYLNIENASHMLKLLSESTFTKGIVAGVPAGVKVAHKFGEATAMQDENTVQSLTLNDCGIVYKPESPFILCIMTEGNDFAEQEQVIAKITQSAYGALE